MTQPAPLTRSYVKHEPKWQRFQAPVTAVPSANQPQKNNKATPNAATATPHPYQRQYSHVYHQRLAALGPKCWAHPDIPAEEEASAAAAAEGGGGVAHVKRILDLSEGAPSVAVGTLVRERDADDADGKDDDKNALHPDSACRKTDALYLEDESGRVALQFDDDDADGGDDDQKKPRAHSYPMGIVVACRGVVGRDGVMRVEAVYPPVPSPSPAAISETSAAISGSSDANKDDRACLLLISGLDCGDPTVPSLPRDMLLSYLEGRFEVPSAARVGQVIVAGGLLAPLPTVNAAAAAAAGSTTSAAATAAAKKVSAADRLAALRDLDGWILSVAAAGVPVDVLPGKNDPTTANWPQRPLHRSLLPQSHRYFSSGGSGSSGGLVHRTPNPYAARLNGKDVVGTDGANIADLKHRVLAQQQKGDSAADSSNMEEEKKLEPVTELEALRLTLEWSHLCPTGPDSVPTAPHPEFDPMVLSSSDDKPLPDLYFCGNASRFATTTVAVGGDDDSKCRLVCVPQFSQTGQAVLVHLDDMKVELLRFLPE